MPICLSDSFIILFPLGVSLLRFLDSFRLHWMLQTIATVICIIGLAVAVVLSVIDIECDSFNTAYQVIGILVVAALFFQAILRYIHHKNFKEVCGRTWTSYAHLWTGRIVILAGMVNTVLYAIPLSHVPLKYLPSSQTGSAVPQLTNPLDRGFVLARSTGGAVGAVIHALVI